MNKQVALKKLFGFDSFREGQENIIDNILGGGDVLGVMPTGAGKSLCFQIPAVVSEGITLVISPLISLMKDQVQALIANGIPAAYINSSLSPKQTQEAISNAKKGIYRILYVAPERLGMYSFLELCRDANIFMVAIDEAHCVSQWGQNFRPSYLKIVDFIDNLPNRPVVAAFTATATDFVRADIVNLLNLKDPLVLVTGFDRPNLFFSVKRTKEKYSALIDYVKDCKTKSGIIYCSTRKMVEEVCMNLNEDGYSATRYHAGLSAKERKQNQDDFAYDKKRIIVATNAFGMGIDKSNVSFVIHYNMPKNLESYYQEAGRAGRDGAPTDCLLLYAKQDVGIIEFLINMNNSNEEIDEALQEQLKQNERKLLRKMTMYCETNDCLRRYILDYFGEVRNSDCDNCGNCFGEYERVDVTQKAQKIISCIQRLNGVFGVNMIIDILRGSKTKRIKENNLQNQSTYGIMSGISADDIRAIVIHLIQSGYIIKTHGKYPVLTTTDTAREILFDGVTAIMKVDINEKVEPKHIKKLRKIPIEYGDADMALFERLKILRMEIATIGSVPAFVVFSNKTLIDMCNKLPRTGDEFLDVSGVGNMKADRYGDRFLEEINEYISEE